MTSPKPPLTRRGSLEIAVGVTVAGSLLPHVLRVKFRAKGAYKTSHNPTGHQNPQWLE